MRIQRFRISQLKQAFRSLQWRLVMIFVLVAVVLMTIAGTSVSYFIESNYYNTFEKRVNKGFQTWSVKVEPGANEVREYFKSPGKEAFYIFGITEYKTITIVNRNLEIIFSNETYAEMENSKLIDELIKSQNFLQALAGGIGNKASINRIGERAFFDYAIPKGNYIYYFRYDREEWKGTVNGFYQIVQSSFLIAVVISLILGIALSRTITRPLIQLMQYARRIAGGDFDAVIQVKSEDEIGKLTKSLQFMAKELKTTLNEISSQKSKVETILHHMTDGLIAFNLQGQLIQVNPAAQKSLGMDIRNLDLSKFFNTFGISLKVNEVIKDSLEEIKPIQFVVNDRILRAGFASFTDENKKLEGIIILLRDITEQQKLDDMRREFVANVSHELRTPLTSIKSYAETLLDGAIDDKDTSLQFLQIIDSEADRMTRLVKDLLQLSRLDNKQMQWNMQPINVDNILKNTIQKFTLEAKTRKIMLEYHWEDNIPIVTADADRVEQVFINILGNAMQYTPEGGKISVSIQHTKEYVNIKIKDTGIGIPQEDLPRIFERFYRVDKARSREQGGTGLGLAIAKEIIDVHHGTIDIFSTVDQGTEVSISLPM